MVAEILLLVVRTDHLQGFKWLVLWSATSDLVCYPLGSTLLHKYTALKTVRAVYLSQNTVRYYTTVKG